MLEAPAQDLIDVRGVIVTVKGNERYRSEHGLQFDFVSRYFAPWIGINEDPVTGLMLYHIIITLGNHYYTTPLQLRR